MAPSGCEATFCATILQPFAEDVPPFCILRCDPSNGNADCPDGSVCDPLIAMLPDTISDGAEGLCQ